MITLTKPISRELDRLKSWLGRHMRTTHVTDMLIEVDNDIRFTDHFLPPAQKGRARNLTPGYNDLLGRRPDIGE